MNHDTSETERECGSESQHALLPHHRTFSTTIFGKTTANVGWFATDIFSSLETSKGKVFPPQS